jgi:hypothetical protein
MIFWAIWRNLTTRKTVCTMNAKFSFTFIRSSYFLNILQLLSSSKQSTIVWNWIYMIFLSSEVVLTCKSQKIKQNSDNYHAQKPKLINYSTKIANFSIKINLETNLYDIFQFRGCIDLFYIIILLPSKLASFMRLVTEGFHSVVFKWAKYLVL